MRIAAEKQVAETQKVVMASDEQAKAQKRPAVAVKVGHTPEGLLLVNAGKGPEVARPADVQQVSVN